MDGCENERGHDDERKLVRAVLEGKPEAAEALFERVFERLYRRVCARLGGDHAAAEDVTSESLIAGLRALGGFRGEASLETWLFRIALGKIADAKRRRALRIVAAGDGELERVLAARESHELSPSDRLERDELRAAVTAALDRRTDDARVIASPGAVWTWPEARRIDLRSGRIYLDVEPDGTPFEVACPDGTVKVLGTRLVVDAAGACLRVVLGSGTATLATAGSEVELSPGEEAVAKPGEKPRKGQARRLSHAADFAGERFDDGGDAGESEAFVPAFARIPQRAGPALPLGVASYRLDVHVEDGLARTTIDQTLLNPNGSRVEGTLIFPLPPDASISRLAMYVDGKLMEGGMAERGHASEVYEGIVRRMQDPAILEWLEGSTFRLRIFPFEPYTERRIVLSYQQPLESLYDVDRYRFPLRRPAIPWDSFSIHAVLKGAARGGSTVSSPTYPLEEVARSPGDVELAFEEKDARPERDVILEIRRPRRPPVELATHEAGGDRFVSIRVTPEVRGEPYRGPRRVLLIVDRTGSPTDSERRAIRRAARRVLGSLDRKDQVAVMTYGTEPSLWREEFVPRTKESLAAAQGFLDAERFFGAGDLDRAFRRAARLFGAPEEGDAIFYVGDGVDSLSGVERERLAGDLPAAVRFFAIPVSRSYDRTLLGSMADRSGGRLLPLSSDERIGWRVFDLVSSLRTPEWRDLDWELLDEDGRPVAGEFRADRRSLRDGESLWIAGKIEGPQPRKLRLGGEIMALPVKAADGAWIPRLWAKLRIEALERDSQAEHREEIVRLSKEYYVMTPFTALLVLENDAMYSQYKIDRGRKDHWALYPAPSAWQGRVVRPAGAEWPSQPRSVWRWSTWGIPTDGRVWFRDVAVPGEDGILNTPDDRILLSGDTVQGWTLGVGGLTPLSEILLPPGGFAFSDSGAWVTLDGPLPTRDLGFYADSLVRTFAPDIEYMRFRNPSGRVVLQGLSRGGQDRWAGRMQHTLDGFTSLDGGTPVLLGGDPALDESGAISAVVLSFRSPMTLPTIDQATTSYAWTAGTAPESLGLSTAPLLLPPMPQEGSTVAPPETLRRYLEARGETTATRGQTRFAVIAGGGRLAVEGKRAAYVGAEGAAAVDPLFETPLVGGFAAAEAARLPWFLTPIDELTSGWKTVERKEGGRTVISLDGGGWTTFEIAFEDEKPLECRETLRGGYVLRCEEYRRWEKVGGAFLPTLVVIRGPARDATTPGEVLEELEYRYGPVGAGDRGTVARLRETISRVASGAASDSGTGTGAGAAAGGGPPPEAELSTALALYLSGAWPSLDSLIESAEASRRETADLRKVARLAAIARGTDAVIPAPTLDPQAEEVRRWLRTPEPIVGELLDRALETGSVAYLEPRILATRDPGLWIRELQRVTKKAPEGLQGLLQLWIGDLAVRNGWHVTAREAYGVAAAWAPLSESVTLQDRLRQVALSLGEVETALAHGEKALGLLEAQGASAAARAACLSALADAADRRPELRRERGRAFLQRWAELEPRNETPFRRLAAIHEEAGRKAEAIRCASQGAELAPSEASYSTLAGELERLGDAERAAACRRIAATYAASAKGGGSALPPGLTR